MRAAFALAFLATACGPARPVAARSDAGAAAPGAPAPSSPPLAAPAPDAAPEPDAEPVRPADVLVGPAAERAIAEQSTDPLVDAPDPDEPVHPGVRGDGYGPLRLGQPRAEVARILGVPTALRRVATPAGQPTVEVAWLPGKDGRPYVKVRVYAGRLESIEILAADPRAVTDRAIGIGASFDEAIEAHGAPRRVDDPRTDAPLGWVLADLPGVIFVPADKAALAEETPREADRVGRILVVGAAATAPND